MLFNLGFPVFNGFDFFICFFGYSLN